MKLLFTRQLISAGLRVIAKPAVEVEHHPQASRLRRESFMDTAQKYGRSKAYIAYHWEHTGHEPILRPLLRTWTSLWYRRFLHFPKWWTKEGIEAWEFEKIQKIAFLKQIAMERRRPRNYSKEGWHKRHGVLASIKPFMSKTTVGVQANASA